jgi:hypothetical protein
MLLPSILINLAKKVIRQRNVDNLSSHCIPRYLNVTLILPKKENAVKHSIQNSSNCGMKGSEAGKSLSASVRASGPLTSISP